MKKLCLAWVMGIFAFSSHAQNQIQITELNDSTIMGALSSTIFGGCVQISNLTYSGAPSAFGIFLDPDSSLGMHQGLAMSTGLAAEISDSSSMFASSSLLYPGDADLDTEIIGQTNDALVLEFDFIPNSDTIFATQFIFGSEEYPEYVCSPYNDVFAFYISGVTTSLPQTNVALIPSTNIPIAINTINNDTACNGDWSQYYVDSSSGTDFVFDGHTSLMNLSHPVIPGETYHMKIGIADVGDFIYDSGVLMKSQTFCGNFWYQNPQFISTSGGGTTVNFENQSYAAQNYLWDFGDGTYSTDENPVHTFDSPGTYPVTLTCSNSCQENELTVNVNVMVTSDSESLHEASWSVNSNSSVLNLYLESVNTHDLKFRILDLSGKLILSEQIGIGSVFTKQVDITSLKSGLYLFQLVDGNQVSTKKFIK